MKLLVCVAGAACFFTIAPVASEERFVDHYDELVFDESLSLGQVIEATFEKYPQSALIAAFENEAKALERRSASWIAGYPAVYLQWIDDRAFNDRGAVEIQTGYQIPVWMWGQRAASRAVAEEATQSTALLARAIRHEVAGLVRDALWNLRLVENRYELAERIYEVSRQLTALVQRRVDVGDLARADLLLAESDELEKKTAVVQAEAEVMHARKSYSNLTRLERAPKFFEEEQSPRSTFDESHPALAVANALIERAQAEVEFTRKSKQGNQPSILVGTQHERGTRKEGYNNETNFVLQIPIGGEAYNAPFVAEANIVLTQRLTDRDILLRQLEKALHEAIHNLEVDRAALTIAERRREIAESQLKMSRLAFETGEISLIDYLKIQATAQAAIRDAAERAILLQRDIAVYNQVVGVTP
ncbi:TolC family protein [Methylocaldum sp. RMAD-M]|uniref:TolC family protein n=1 Tax=Methylocaldum sp. RMAD-M TaxID=2806557 RepID=UPI001AE8B09F|nr:TolC family protein [Methylocaldum sp. RMAD-M]MBP1152875.1 outer membrane protein TolC [Methylocaldum sp. RMAD-M]